MPNSWDTFLEILEYRNVQKGAVDTADANPGTAHIAFYVDDSDSIFARLQEAGVPSVSGVRIPTAGPNMGGKVVYLIDPDGIRVELMQTAVTLAGEPRHASSV